MGKMVEVEVVETGKHFLKARLKRESAIREPGLAKPLVKGEVSGVLRTTDVTKHQVCIPLIYILQRNCSTVTLLLLYYTNTYDKSSHTLCG